MKHAHLFILTGLLIILPMVQAFAQSSPNDAAEAAKMKFQIRKLKVGKKVVIVEIADTSDKRAQGLMFRKSLPGDHGMLFVFETEDTLAFWMKNTLIPLSIGYFDHDRTLVRVREMTPALASEVRPPTYSSGSRVLYALEMPAGWFSKNKIEPGATFFFADQH